MAVIENARVKLDKYGDPISSQDLCRLVFDGRVWELLGTDHMPIPEKFPRWIYTTMWPFLKNNARFSKKSNTTITTVKCDWITHAATKFGAFAELPKPVCVMFDQDKKIVTLTWSEYLRAREEKLQVSEEEIETIFHDANSEISNDFQPLTVQAKVQHYGKIATTGGGIADSQVIGVRDEVREAALIETKVIDFFEAKKKLGIA